MVDSTRNRCGNMWNWPWRLVGVSKSSSRSGTSLSSTKQAFRISTYRPTRKLWYRCPNNAAPAPSARTHCQQVPFMPQRSTVRPTLVCTGSKSQYSQVLGGCALLCDNGETTQGIAPAGLCVLTIQPGEDGTGRHICSKRSDGSSRRTDWRQGPSHLRHRLLYRYDVRY